MVPINTVTIVDNGVGQIVLRDGTNLETVLVTLGETFGTVVGEIRDKETAESVLSLSETGHLVFSTLHTPSASGTINRFISFFSPEIQDSVASRIADSLLGVLSQFLVKNADGKSRVGIYELMLNTLAVKNNIIKKQIMQIDNVIETNNANGMISMKQYAQRLIDKNIINADAAAFILGNVIK